ncbi:hypothetical protein PR202_ga04099 [Eleusine coracana subsp. coracana]|uniref:RING-type domain-containing protein n=1 Tax=Eleusine coracana subsp. coracana TaxID=191504 RepID=A0AAV5BQS7_ELECO|nr:hypothetical protein QOZ80_5AG0380410 [Eleusine coracana subsp. coracana]GJM88075.1 hypothetical protein PR202_ga04099 [Eleusine coracana subsp. coracana]
MDAPRAPPPAAASAAQGNTTRLRVLRGGQMYMVEVNTRDLPPLRRSRRPDDDEAARRNLHRGSTSRMLPPVLEQRLPRHWTRPVEDEHGEEHSSINHHKRARLVPANSKAPYEGVTPGEPGLQGECAICLEDFKAKDALRAMPCSHRFHLDCLFVWLRAKPICPLCRHALPTRRQQLGMLVPDA